MSCVFGYGIVATAIYGEVVIYQFDGESQQLEEVARLDVGPGFVNQVRCFVEDNSLKVAYVVGKERRGDRLEKVDCAKRLGVVTVCELEARRGRFGRK